MNDRQAARLWLVLGGASLACLWLAVLWRPAWAGWAGTAFLLVPFAVATLMTWPRFRQDSVSALCALGLTLLFCLAWFL